MIDNANIVVGGGLSFFNETENALYGINDILQFMNDPRYDFEGLTSLGVTQGNWEITWTWGENNPFEGKIIKFPSSTNAYPYKIGCRPQETIYANGGGFLFLSKSSTCLSFNHRGVVPGATDPNNWSQNGAISYSSVAVNSKTSMTLTNDAGRTAPGFGLHGARATVEYEGETWYCLCVIAEGFNYVCDIVSSVTNYISASEIPHYTEVGYQGYDTIEDAVSTLMSESIEGDGKYSGLARTGGLAFFAGGEDEFGKDAPIKIYTDGTYEGLDKVGDVKYGDTSLVTNGIAQLNTLQEKLTAGSNIQINNNTISATNTTYIAGTNVQINNNVISATDTTYSDFSGSTHGLVPSASSGDSGKFLKSDGTWAEAGGGGGGTTVIANPSGTATDTLVKLQVGNDIYSVSSGGGATTLAQLSDVDISNLQDGESLVWNATTQKWENQMVSGGGSQTEANYGTYRIIGECLMGEEGTINE